jgi:hypothetical protein
MHHSPLWVSAVAALCLLGCGKSDPVAEQAVAPPDHMVGDGPAEGLASPANAAAAEAHDSSSAPVVSQGMTWRVQSGGRAVTFGPVQAEPVLTIACAEGSGIEVVRHDAASAGATATLSLTGGGHASSLPMAASPTPRGPGGAEWKGRVTGDMARAIARPFERPGVVNISLGGAPDLIVPADPAVRAMLSRCA